MSQLKDICSILFLSDNPLSYLTHNKGEKGQKMNMHKNNKMYE